MTSDIRPELLNAVRALARTPSVTLAMLLTMVLGVGATGAVSTVVWKVLMQPLPIRDASRVLVVHGRIESLGRDIPAVSYPDLNDWRRRAPSFAGIAGYTGVEGALLGADGPVPLDVAQVGEDFFTVLAPAFAVGGALPRASFDEGAGRTVVLSHALWQREFAADPGIVGRSIRLESGSAIVTGVVAPGQFMLPESADLWSPLSVASSGPLSWQNSRASQWLQAVARVRAGVPVDAAIRELVAVDATVREEFARSTNPPIVVAARPLQEQLTGPVRSTLTLLAAALVVVLALVCTNIATLRMVQARRRQRDFAVRMVLGAPFPHLRRQVLTETLVLCAVGAALGLATTHPILRGLLALYPGRLPRADQISMDPVVALWSVGVALSASLLIAVPTLWSLARMDAGALVRHGERQLVSRRQDVTRRLIVVAQLGLSVVMLVASGLLMRSFLNVTSVAPGFDPAGITSFAVAAPSSRYPSFEHAERLFESIGERISAIPGVRQVEATNAMPLTSNPWRNSLRRTGMDQALPGTPANIRLVSPGYLDLIDVPVLRGRSLAPSDDEQSPRVVVINEQLASLLFGDADPVGQMIQVDGPVLRTVVGVVRGFHHAALTQPVDPEAYVTFRQAGTRRVRVIAVGTAGDGARLFAALEQAVREIDPQLPIRSVRSLEEIVGTAVAPQRFRAAFVGSLAIIALTLAVIGVYGVMSATVSQRTREMGIRMALGESPAAIRRRIVLDGLVLAGGGALLGGLGAWMATRALQGFLFGVTAGDPLTLGAVTATLVVVTILAADGPARRAGRVDPVTAISHD